MLYQRSTFSVPASGGTDPRLLERCKAGSHGMTDRRGLCCHCGDVVPPVIGDRLEDQPLGLIDAIEKPE